ncbi:Sir2 family NAD-dependent protein deacetylase [Saccharopolyspora sp.]|uniref:SIR2 family NAD-dependent protein deacylase n=1 Tax=Saccharopolyspora sp. TaxID=33915 RepID=UPI0025E0060C|nr:Sir2 family NAD-dependent protein deacetylase [Saccharopolyspora sp.]
MPARGSSEALERARALFAGARRITALTGAGLSTASGIPDFRGPNGVWTRDPEAQRLSDINSYVADPEVRRKAWRSRAEHPAWSAEPNAAHRAFTDLAAQQRLRTVLTQNIDGLHQSAGLDSGSVLELHGSVFGVVCLDCGSTGTMRAALQRVAAGEPDPPCNSCGGILKSSTISFGQALDADVIRSAQRAALDCDLFLTAGTSLTVQPAAGLAELAVRAGADLVVCNAEPTPYDELAAAVLREPLVEVLPELVAVPATGSDEPLSTWGDPGTWS